MTRPAHRGWGRFALLLLVCFTSLQAYFAGRIALMRVVDPASTTLQRSEAWRLALDARNTPWKQRWVDYDAMSTNLKSAVVAAEDASFTEHSGVEWDALEKAWERNQRAEATAERLDGRMSKRPPDARPPRREAKVVGGSTITQQLAKNLFLGGERSFARKAQELVLAYEIEALLGKRRILEIYLDSVEWGEGVFGAEAASRHYFRTGASSLSVQQAAQLAVMLPAPKRFEKRPGSPYVMARAGMIAARMSAVDLP